MTTSAPFPTAGETKTVVEPQLPHQTDVVALNRDAAGLRDVASLLHARSQQLHGDTQRAELSALTNERLKRGVGDLLDELSIDHGMAWSHIARLVGVSVPALRKWRQGSAPDPENRRRLAGLSAFLELLARFPVEEPSGWLEARLTDESTLTGLDVYSTPGGAVGLLEYAGRRCSAEGLLDAQIPDWRAASAPDPRLRIVETDDGGRSLVLEG